MNHRDGHELLGERTGGIDDQQGCASQVGDLSFKSTSNPSQSPGTITLK
jgi:hypothetical protein